MYVHGLSGATESGLASKDGNFSFCIPGTVVVAADGDFHDLSAATEFERISIDGNCSFSMPSTVDVAVDVTADVVDRMHCVLK